MTPDITLRPLLTLASGDHLTLQEYCFRGASPGRIVYLQANLHGAELAGNVVIQRLIDYLQTLDDQALRGEIRLVPVCNPIGVNTRAHQFASGRFNPYDGRDWNRIFWDYEQVSEGAAAFAAAHSDWAIADIQTAFRGKIWHQFQEDVAALDSPMHCPTHRRYRTRLQQRVLDADILIDLHTSANQGLVYLYYFRDRADAIPAFGVDFGILLDRYDGNAFDEAFINPWLALEAAYAAQGRSLRFDIEAWTLELGSSHVIDSVAVERGVAGILNYLRYRGVLTDASPHKLPTVPLSRSSQLVKYYATTGGFVQNRVALGQWITTGETLYEVLSFPKAATLPMRSPVQAQQSGLVYDLGWNQAVSEGEYILAVMVPDVADC